LKSHQKFVRVLLICIAFTGLFGLTSYFIKQAPTAQKTPKPIAQATSLNTVFQKFANQESKSTNAKMRLYQQRLSYQVYRLQNELKETKAAYQELMVKYDSLLNRVDSVSQKNIQKAESGSEN